MMSLYPLYSKAQRQVKPRTWMVRKLACRAGVSGLLVPVLFLVPPNPETPGLQATHEFKRHVIE